MENEESGKRLAVLSCSNRKRDLPESTALEVYDGPTYKMLRKYSRKYLDVLILSAKYGLISADTKISTYNQKMTDSIAREIRDKSTDRLAEFLNSRNYDEIYVDLGKTYMNAIDFANHRFDGQNFVFSSGTIGVRLHKLKLWLSKIRE